MSPGQLKTTGELQPAKKLLSEGQYEKADTALDDLEERGCVSSSDDELLSLRMKIIIKGKLPPEVLADAKDQEPKKSKFIASRVLDSWLTSDFTNLMEVMQRDVNTVIKVNKDMRDAFGLVYDVYETIDKQDSESTEKKLTEEKLDKALVLLKNNPIISRFCGPLYFGIDSYQKAVAALLVAIQKDEKDITVNFFLGASYAELKDYENAKKYLFKGMSLDIFKKTLHSKDYGLMREYWVACQEEKESNLDFYAQHAHSCLQAGKFQEAVDHYTVAIWLSAARKTEDIDLYRKKRTALAFLGQNHLFSSFEFHVACVQFIELYFPETVVKTKVAEEHYRFSIELMEQGQREYKAERHITSLAFFSKALLFLVPAEEWNKHFSKEECDLLQTSSYLCLKGYQDEKTIAVLKNRAQQIISEDARKAKMGITLDKVLQLLACKTKQVIEKQAKQKAPSGLGQYCDELNNFYAKAMLEKEKAGAEMKAVAATRKAKKKNRKKRIKNEKQLESKTEQQEQKQEQKSVTGLIPFKGFFGHNSKDTCTRDDARNFHKFVNDVFIFYMPFEHTKTMVWHFLKVNLKEDSAFERTAIMLQEFFSLDGEDTHFEMFVELGLMKKFFPDVLTGDQMTALQEMFAKARNNTNLYKIQNPASSEVYKQYLAQSSDLQDIVKEVTRKANGYSLEAATRRYQC